MSLVFQMISAGNGSTATPVTGAVSTGVSADGTGSLLPFAQALIQQMTTSVDSKTVSANATTEDPIALLQGLLKQIQQPTDDAKDGKTSSKADLLSELAQDIEKLDDSIENDPSLLASLQGWLLQVSALLTNNLPQEEQAESTAVLSPLAQNPETLRFAVQDDLNRLVSIIKEAATSGNEELTTKGLSVLNNFTEIMSQSASLTVKSNDVRIQNQSTTDNQITQNDKGGDGVSSLRSKPTESDSSDADLSSALQSKVAVKADVKKAFSADESVSEFTIPTDTNEIVTAGQLSMRNGITAPLKVEVPQVPVQHFASEMTSMITGKLEIVKRGGVAEATISLFPENLGQVDVKITMQNGHIVAQFVTEHGGSKNLLEQQMGQLRTALQSQGLQVEKLEVTQNNTPLQSQMQQEGRQPNSGGQQSGKRSNNQNEASADAVLAAELNGEMKDWLENGISEDGNQTNSFSAKA